MSIFKENKLFCLLVFFLGFVFYPLIFVPIAYKTGLLDQWIVIYAEYLRLWGM